MFPSLSFFFFLMVVFIFVRQRFKHFFYTVGFIGIFCMVSRFGVIV